MENEVVKSRNLNNELNKIKAINARKAAAKAKIVTDISNEIVNDRNLKLKIRKLRLKC